MFIDWKKNRSAEGLYIENNTDFNASLIDKNYICELYWLLCSCQLAIFKAH